MKLLFRFVFFIGMITALLFLAWSACGADRVRESADLAADNPQQDISDGRVTRVLVMGTDRAAKLTDSMFVVTVDEAENIVRILQIPRDTYANYTDRDYKKINGALNTVGAKQLKQMLSDAFGAPIHYFLVMDLSILEDLVDAVGGVDIESPVEMHYTDPEQGLEIHLPKGLNHLNGKNAQQFVRYRSGYANADLGRLDAQKLFLEAFAKKCSTLSSVQIARISCMALTRLQSDMDLPAMVRLSSLMGEVDSEQISIATISGQAEQGKSGAWYYVLNRAGACRMVNEYFMPREPIMLSDFDQNGLFDRPEHQRFHKIYMSPEEKLPV